MVPNLAGTKHAIRSDVDPIGGDDGTAVQSGVTADADHRLASSGDETVDLRMRPGVDVGLEHDLPRAGNAESAVSK